MARRFRVPWSSGPPYRPGGVGGNPYIWRFGIRTAHGYPTRHRPHAANVTRLIGGTRVPMRWYPNLQQYRTSLSIAANALDRSATLFKPRSTTAAAIHSKRWSSRSKGFAIGGVAAIGVAGAAAYAIKRRRQSRKAAGHHYQNRPPQLTRQQRQQMARRRRRVRGRFA